MLHESKKKRLCIFIVWVIGDMFTVVVMGTWHGKMSTTHVLSLKNISIGTTPTLWTEDYRSSSRTRHKYTHLWFEYKLYCDSH